VRALGDMARSLIPGIRGVDVVQNVEADRPVRELVVIEDSLPGSSRLADLSSGVQHLLLLAALYVAPRTPRLILLEEPDTGVHVGALPALCDLLLSLSRMTTVIATSHSPAFVGLFDPERHVTALERNGEHTRAVSLASAMRSRRWLDSFAGADAFIRAGSERLR